MLAILLVVIAGCRQPVDFPDAHADLACETAYAITRDRQHLKPSPAPASDKCENCDGTGKIGDGRIVMTCPVCKGTGKKAASVMVTKPCKDGKCSP